MKTGESLSVPLGLTIEFTLTEGGEASAQVSFDITNDNYFEKGFDATFDGLEVKDFTPYNTDKQTFSLGTNFNGEVTQTSGIGADFSLIVGGLVPAKITNDFQLATSVKGTLGINTTYDGELNTEVSGCAEYSNALQLKGDVLLRVAVAHDKNMKEINETFPLYSKTFWKNSDNFCIKPKMTYEEIKGKERTYLFDSKETESTRPLTKYEWTITKTGEKDKVKRLGQQMEYTFPEAGEYEVILKVTDTKGSTREYTETLQVKDSTMALNEAKQKSRFTTVMHDEKGNEYQIYFLGINDHKWVAGPDDIWAAISEGDILFEGDFQIGLQPKGSNLVYIQPITIKDYQYNKTRDMVFTIQSQSVGRPDFLFVSTREASVGSSSSIYYIKDGVFRETKTKVEDNLYEGLFFSTRPKIIGNNRIQLIDYYNAEPIGFEFSTYIFNPSTGIFSYQGSKFYFDEEWDEGKLKADRWIRESDYFVETPEKWSDYFGD